MSDPYAESLVREIESIQKELTLIAQRRKKLVDQQKLAKSRLGTHLIKNKKESYGNYQTDKLVPKDTTKTTRKKKKEQYEEGVKYFESIGHQNPVQAYTDFITLHTGKPFVAKKKK